MTGLLMTCIPRPKYSSLRKACYFIAVFSMIYRVVLTIYLCYMLSSSNPHIFADYLIRVVWGIIFAVQWMGMFVAVYKEHVCLMFTVTYVEFLQLVSYNMYRITYLTNHSPSYFLLSRMVLECLAGLIIFPIIYLYYKQLKNKSLSEVQNEDQDRMSRFSTLASVIIFPAVYFYYLQLKSSRQYGPGSQSDLQPQYSRTSNRSVA